MNEDLARACAVEMEGTDRGLRAQVLERYATAAGVSLTTLRRHLATATTPRDRPAAQQPRVPPELRADLEVLVRVKKAPPKITGRELSLRRALRVAIEHQMIGPELARQSESTLSRWIRSLGLGQEERRISRFQASRPNESHQFDATHSDAFRVKESLPDGDVLLILHPHASGYKNHPLGPDRLRWVVYGVVDDHSGYRLARGTAALGENAVDALGFLRWAWAPQDDAAGGAIPFCGRPEALALDQGPLGKDRAFRDLFVRLAIPLITGEPGNTGARGKVERPWRDLWEEFEAVFWVAAEWGGDSKKVQITGADYNRRLLAFLVERNELLHRQGGRTKREAWQTIAHHGGPVLIPDEAWGTAIKPPVQRWVDREGYISFKRGAVARWEVPGLMETHVHVLEGALDNRLVAVDLATGRKIECKPARMLALGEFRAAKTPPGARLRGNPPPAGAGAQGRRGAGAQQEDPDRPNSSSPPRPSSRVAAFKPRAQVAPMPADPRAGAEVGAAWEDPLAAVMEATAPRAVDLDRFGVLDLFADHGIPVAAARPFVWARVAAAASLTEPEAAVLLAEFQAGRRAAVGE